MYKFIRVCQECGHKQIAKDPKDYIQADKEAWRNTKCKKCKSEALNYGSYKEIK